MSPRRESPSLPSSSLNPAGESVILDMVVEIVSILLAIVNLVLSFLTMTVMAEGVMQLERIATAMEEHHVVPRLQIEIPEED